MNDEELDKISSAIEKTLPMGRDEFAALYQTILAGGLRMHSEYTSAVVAVGKKLGLPKELMHLAVELIYAAGDKFDERYNSKATES